MREEKHTVIATVSKRGVVLPDTPYTLWTRGELDTLLGIPDDGTRVEVIGREIVVTPPPLAPHNKIFMEVAAAFNRAEGSHEDFPWRVLAGTGVDLLGVENGYIPDLLVMDADMYRRATARYVVPDEVELVVEVTSPSNAIDDRRPKGRRSNPTKWEGYARAEIPYYLLIDRDPKVARSTLYSIPDQGSAAYLHEESWALGEAIVLPDPFGIEIPTADWQPWPNHSDQ